MNKNIIVISLILLLSKSAYAHKLKVFAWTEDKTVVGYCYYPGGKRASGIDIKLIVKGNTAKETVSNKNGEFSFKDNSAAELTVKAETKDGHSSLFEIKGNENVDALSMDNDSKSDLKARVVSLEKRLEKLEENRSLLNIAGAVGIIIGLFGIWAYFLARKKFFAADYTEK
ncbi:MAG: hypothetical protein ACYTFY_05635 [Planctomycetota bacterium]